MRTINQRPEPAAFAEWRAASQADINYGYDLIPGELRIQVKTALVEEQRGICAYTGIGINMDRSHIEHLIPQANCVQGEGDVAYSNMAACYPGPDGAYVPFGAVFKANWPSPAEQHLFVSPHSANCEARFSFSIRGKISVAPADEAARVTVERLGLHNKRLQELRKESINATLHWHGRDWPLLDLSSARKRLASLEQAENAGSRLEPFCFALKPALRKHISRLEFIRESKRGGRR